MILNISKIADKSLISFSEGDRIDSTNLKIIKEQYAPILTDITNKSEISEQVFDFRNISFIDSSGLAFIINIYKNLAEHQISLSIINANTVIDNVFNITKLNTYVNVSKE